MYFYIQMPTDFLAARCKISLRKVLMSKTKTQF